MEYIKQELNRNITSKKENLRDGSEEEALLKKLMDAISDKQTFLDLDIVKIGNEYPEEVVSIDLLQNISMFQLFLAEDFDLEKEQEEEKETFITKLYDEVSKRRDTAKEEYQQGMNKINKIETTITKMDAANSDLIDDEDLEIIAETMANKPMNDRLNAIKSIIIINGQKANKARQLEVPETSVAVSDDSDVDDYSNLEEFQETNLSFDKVKEIFEKYNLTIENNDTVKNTILKYGNYDNIDQMLDFLVDKIGNKVKSNILIILAFSTREAVENKFKFVNGDQNMFSTLLANPTIFMPSDKKVKDVALGVRRKRIKSGDTGSGENKPGSKNSDNANETLEVQGLSGIFEKNCAIMVARGFTLDELVNKNIGVLKNPHLAYLLEVLDLYGFNITEKSALSTLVNRHFLELGIDRFIEADLYDYSQNHLTRVYRNSTPLFIQIHNAKMVGRSLMDGRGRLDIKSIEGAPNINDDIIDLEEAYKQMGYKPDKLLGIASKSRHSNAHIALEDERIKRLEEENLDEGTNQAYNIDGVLLSRNKTLKIFSQVMKDPTINRDDGLIFALTYNSILNQEEFDKVCSYVKGKKEVK